MVVQEDESHRQGRPTGSPDASTNKKRQRGRDFAPACLRVADVLEFRLIRFIHERSPFRKRWVGDGTTNRSSRYAATFERDRPI